MRRVLTTAKVTESLASRAVLFFIFFSFFLFFIYFVLFPQTNIPVVSVLSSDLFHILLSIPATWTNKNKTTSWLYNRTGSSMLPFLNISAGTLHLSLEITLLIAFYKINKNLKQKN